MVAVGEAQRARSFLMELDGLGLLWGRLKALDGLYGFCGGGSRSSSFLWELDGLYGCCGEGSRSSIVSVGARRALRLLWGRLKDPNRFCGSLTGSMVAVGDAQGARSFLWELDRLYGCFGEAQGAQSFLWDRFCGCLTGSMVAVEETQGARSFLWEPDGLDGCCGEG